MPRSTLTSTDRHAQRIATYTAEEHSAGHRDARERGEVRALLDGQLNMRAMPDAVACELLGLAQGSLRDGSLTTDVLRAALEHLQRQPLWEPSR